MTEMKEPKDPTATDIKKLGMTDPIIKRCFSAFDVTTRQGWEQALITALYFKTMIAEVTSEELALYKRRYGELKKEKP